jgi:hypothetical protein
MRVSATVLAATALLFSGGCRGSGAAPRREPKVEAPPATEVTSAYYRELFEAYGDRLSVGTVPVGADIGSWISSKTEARPTADEYQRFYDDLSKSLRAHADRRLPGVDFLKVAYLGGDFLGDRTEELLFEPKVYLHHIEVFIEVLDLIQAYLQAPEHRQYRLAYFSPSASLLVYPDAVFVGPRRFARGADAREALLAWLRQMDVEMQEAREASKTAAP